mgnify:CR=1 FL=1
MAGRWRPNPSSRFERARRACSSFAVNARSKIPLGSLWKLVSYAGLAESGEQEPPYVCKGVDKEEVYCCGSGERIERGPALWKSCGPYFAPQRIGWQNLQHGNTLHALPPSLQTLRNAASLRPETQVPLEDWLQWLAAWPAGLRSQVRDDLLGYWLQGPGRSVLGQVGSQLRVKTFTVQDAHLERMAGASGWTQAGWPIWFTARGSSAAVLKQWAPVVLAHLERAAPQALQAQVGEGACVDVQYFARYPLQQVLDSKQRAVASGRLPVGNYEVRFSNGRTLPIRSEGELVYEQNQIRGRLQLEDYVARVVQREGTAQPREAARALALAARSYLQQNASAAGACLRIADSSATQRVAPRPASSGALAAAAFSAGVVLGGAPIQFHHTLARPGVMSWSQAVQQAQQGLQFDEILLHAYPLRSFVSMSGHGGADCEPMPLAQVWLAQQRVRWSRALARQDGFHEPGAVQLCRQRSALPSAMVGTQRIHVRGVHALEDRLSLTHEYLHLAFAGHPRGQDEQFIESQARQLLGVE